MEEREAESEIYLVEHLREALAQDPRVGELGIAVEIRGKTVFLRGTMTSPEQQDAAVAIARDFLPEHHVRTEVAVASLPEPTDAEHLP
jgi:hypothetical protein